ncbi:hypothetical protein [Nevskia ramosa]|uniref:hypothetical protein n=1 Tax=Nevskia ramosa TaxID=64002 RepID=UPI0003B4CC91|nr:hypothetical protein [Nevskia ramosa]
MLTAPIDHPLNLATQSVLTYGSYLVTAVLLVIAIVMGIRQKTPFYVLLIVAAFVGAFAEALYDVGMTLWFYTPGLWTTFTAYGIPQPVWAHSGYVVLYAGPAMFICDRIAKGLTATGLYQWAAIELACSCVFEMIGINGGLYEYWGPHAFRILNYPLAIGMLETAQVVCLAVAAAELRRRSTSHWPLLGLIVMFPCTFYLGNFGAGAPMIIALHLENPSMLMSTICSAISIGVALVLIFGASKLLPAEQAAAVARRPVPSHLPQTA